MVNDEKCKNEYEELDSFESENYTEEEIKTEKTKKSNEKICSLQNFIYQNKKPSQIVKGTQLEMLREELESKGKDLVN